MAAPTFDTVTSLREKLADLESRGHGNLPVVLYLDIAEDAAKCSGLKIVMDEGGAPYVGGDYPEVAFPHLLIEGGPWG